MGCLLPTGASRGSGVPFARVGCLKSFGCGPAIPSSRDEDLVSIFQKLCQLGQPFSYELDHISAIESLVQCLGRVGLASRPCIELVQNEVAHELAAQMRAIHPKLSSEQKFQVPNSRCGEASRVSELQGMSMTTHV